MAKFKTGKIGKTVALLAMFAIVFTVPVSASLGDTPDNVDTSVMNSLIKIVFWAVRIIIAAAGGIPAVIKITQGQADENPRDRNAGIAGLVVTGVMVGATFGIEALF